MVVEYYDLEKMKEDFMKESFVTERDFSRKVITFLIGRINALKLSSTHFNEIHLDADTLMLLQDTPTFSRISKKGGSLAMGTFAGEHIFLHSPKERHISFYDGMEEVVRVYLIDRFKIREKRFKKLLGK